MGRPVVGPVVKIIFKAQHIEAEEVTLGPLARAFDIEPDNGMLKGVKYIQASFD
jgi:hypothetical protein